MYDKVRPQAIHHSLLRADYCLYHMYFYLERKNRPDCVPSYPHINKEQMGKILDRLTDGRVLVSDGAWGTFLHEKGLKVGECPELWNVERPEEVEDIARSYVEAGSNVIETNSFGASTYKLEAFGLAADFLGGGGGAVMRC